MKKATRKKLKARIITMYSTVKEFCDDIGFSQSGVSGIITGRNDGGDLFWFLAGKALKIPKEEIEIYKQKT